MTSPLRRLLFACFLVVLIASACSGSSDGTETATVSDSESAHATGNTGDADADAERDATADEVPADDAASTDGGVDDADDSVPEDDPAAEEAIAGLDGGDTSDGAPLDPSDTVVGFIRSRFNIDPEPAWTECIVAEAADDAVLDAAVRSQNVADGNMDDTQLKALTFAIAGCVDSASLGDWATQAVGPQGEVRDTAPACFAERFDSDGGDLTFYTFVALTFQFRVDPAGVPDVTDAFVDCTPVTSLSDFFANQAETAANFDITIDRECLLEELSAREASETFWSALIEGSGPPVDSLTPYIDACSEAFEADPNLTNEVPADFVAWSGSGALRTVSPAVRVGLYDTPPPMTIDPAQRYVAVFETGDGEVRIELFADSTPVTVNNFVNLARDGFYDGTIFHRVLEGFMAQGGDPTGTGTGGPGYRFEDEVIDGIPFDRKGLLAMANSGPDTNGSQFFITFAPTPHLTGLHTVFGEVIEGIEIVDAIQLRDPGNPTNRGQRLESVTIIEG